MTKGIILNNWVWIAIGLSLIILELSIFFSNFFLVWIGIAAITVGIIKTIFPAMIWQYQLTLFLLISSSILYIWPKYFKKISLLNKTDSPNLNDKMSSMIGKEIYITEDVEDIISKITIEGVMWKIKSKEKLRKGDLVKITGYNDSYFEIEKID